MLGRWLLVVTVVAGMGAADQKRSAAEEGFSYFDPPSVGQGADSRPALAPAAEPVVNETSSSLSMAERLQRVEQQLLELQGTPLSGPVLTSPACPQCASSICGGDCLPVASPRLKQFPEINVTGMFQIDWGSYHQSSLNQATLGDIEDGLGFRRARLGATGRVSEDVRYLMEFDFAQAQARFVDVWMEFQNTRFGNVRIGRFRQPFGMDELTSIRAIPFLERAAPTTLSPFRQTGIMLHDTAFEDSLTWAVSGYRSLSDNFGNVYSDTGGYGIASRLTALPVSMADDRLIHIGGDFSYNDAGRDQIQFASTNEFFVGQNPNLALQGLSVLPIVAVPPFVTTGEMDADSVTMLNTELAFANRNFMAQSEARWAVVDRLDGSHNTFSGAYAHFRYLLTGESFPYVRNAGVFGRVQPARPVDGCWGHWGAWEFAGRVSYYDLNGDDLPGPGRRLTNLTAGLNWYLNGYTKFQWNYIHSSLDDPNLGTSDAGLFAMRGELDF